MAMTETTSTPAPSFEDALQWTFTNGAIMRFFEDGDSRTRKRPSVRITVVSDLDPDDTRYVAVHYLEQGQTIQEAFAIAALSVKEQFEAGEAEIVAKREQAARPRLRLA